MKREDFSNVIPWDVNDTKKKDEAANILETFIYWAYQPEQESGKLFFRTALHKYGYHRDA